MHASVIQQIQCRNQNQIEERNVHNFEDTPGDERLSVLPPNLEFSFDSGNFTTQEKTIDVTNYSSKACPIQLLPPETRYFQIRNTAQKTCLNPGSVFKVHIAFAPDENRNYNDALRIRHSSNRLVHIKIYAKPVTKFFFPVAVNFGNVPLGRTVRYELPIHSHAEKEFSFAIASSRGVSCLDIYPRWGRMVPGQKPIIIMIIYKPVRYISANFQVQIFVSDLCKTPHVINFFAYTCPGLLRDTLDSREPEVRSESPQKKISVRNYTERKVLSRRKEPATKCTSDDNIILKQCASLPSNTLHAVNCILNSKEQELFAQHELEGPLNAYLFERVQEKAKKLKEFFAKVKSHNHRKLNSRIDCVDNIETTDIKVRRTQDWENYKNLTTNSEVDIYEQTTTKKRRRRILRDSKRHPMTIGIQSQGEGLIYYHHCKVPSFLQAARKIVLKHRLLNILKKLRGMTREFIQALEDLNVKHD